MAGNVISGNRTGVSICCQADHNFVQGNLVGVDATGTQSLGNDGFGIDINGSSENLIGGAGAGAGNVISSNGSGVSIRPSEGGLADGTRFRHEATGNVLQGNLIGTDLTGTMPLGNNGTGVAIADASGSVIGGPMTGAGNVISANAFDGILLIGGTTATVVQANRIGTDLTGLRDRGNGHDGILVQSGVGDLIGGTTPLAANWIAHNGRNGITIQHSDGIGVLSNAIHANAQVGIDLGVGDGVTPNDAGDRDAGPNGLQNFPVLSSVTMRQGLATINGKLHSTPGTNFRIELFANDHVDESGHGEGQRLIGATDVTTNRRGAAFFSVRLPLAAFAGQFITATATDPDNNTSEFSRARQVSRRAGTDAGEIDPGRPAGPAPLDRAAAAGAGLFDAALDQLIRRRRRWDAAGEQVG